MLQSQSNHRFHNHQQNSKNKWAWFVIYSITQSNHSKLWTWPLDTTLPFSEEKLRKDSENAIFLVLHLFVCSLTARKDGGKDSWRNTWHPFSQKKVNKIYTFIARNFSTVCTRLLVFSTPRGELHMSDIGDLTTDLLFFDVVLYLIICLQDSRHITAFL